MKLSVFSRSGVQKSKGVALDRLFANVMIADADLTIRYMNPAVISLLREAESDLKKELPRFSVDTLIGSNIDVFHKNPSHQRTMLSRLQAEHKATIKIGERAFDLRVMPLVDGTRRGGFVVEWNDAKDRLQNIEYAAQGKAIDRWQAIIEFTPEGIITFANENFLRCIGYSLSEIKGKHHRMFIDGAEQQSEGYRRFWETLGRGEFHAGEFKRIKKGGGEIWIQGVYNPIISPEGKVLKVIKSAMDVTARVEAVQAIGDALSRLADGNLEHQIGQPLTPELDKLRVDFNSALGTLQTAMQKVDQSARTIDRGTSEIRTSSADLSRRTEQQAASLEETAAALDEITATVRTTADGAKQARSIVSNAKVNAEQSGRVVQQAVDAMGGIEKSSREISQIIGVIDEIAFQTNLLALNAGVEAARAGEAGRGFAVVASEVRALAQRSAEAAKQIKTLISSSGDQVQQGVALVGQTGESLARLVTQVSEIDGIVGEITSSAEEQARGLGEVNSAVNQMDQVTQQNAAMVEEATAASQELAKETAELSRLVGQFSIGTQAYAPARAVSAARPASSAQTPVRALRTVGRGGAARALEPAAGQEWTEF